MKWRKIWKRSGKVEGTKGESYRKKAKQSCINHGVITGLHVHTMNVSVLVQVSFQICVMNGPLRPLREFYKVPSFTLRFHMILGFAKE